MEDTKAIRSFEDLEVWKSCRDVRVFVAELVNKLPADERYRLRDQMIRATRSATANIAEGIWSIPLSREYPVLQAGERFTL